MGEAQDAVNQVGGGGGGGSGSRVVSDWNGADGAALQLWDCAGTANQKWHRA